MKLADSRAIGSFLFNEGYIAEDNPAYYIRGNTAIDVFEDGLVQIWRKKEDTTIGEFKIKCYASFVKKYREKETLPNYCKNTSKATPNINTLYYNGIK